MRSLGNIIWFTPIGCMLALIWLILAGIFASTVVGLPMARSFLEFAKLSAFPFGKEIIRQTELKGSDNVSTYRKIVSVVLNVLWVPIEIMLTLLFFIGGILSFIFGIVFFCTVVGFPLSLLWFPVGVVLVKMGKFVLFPIGCRVVTQKQAYASATANEIEKRMKRKKE